MTKPHCQHCGSNTSGLYPDLICTSCIDRRMNVSRIAKGAEAEFSRAETEMERRTMMDCMAARLRGIEMTLREPLIHRKPFHEGLFGHPWFESNPLPRRHAEDAFIAAAAAPRDGG